jgi:glycosyltransferase involved in cell wall biosynthesis
MIMNNIIDKNPLISIIIATFNVEDCLENLIQSIIPQKNEKIEFIIIDGLSKDNTIEIIQKYSSIIDFWITEPDKGIYDAWNKGIKVSQGEWIMFIGADDVLLPNAIDNYLNILKHNIEAKEVDYICAKNEYVDKNGQFLKTFGMKPSWNNMRKMNVVAHVASLHNKNRLFNEIGLYDLNFKICADYELLLRKGKRLKYLFIPDHIARMAVGGMSFSSKALIEEYKVRAKHHSVTFLGNVILFLIRWSALNFFVVRKKLQGAKL